MNRAVERWQSFAPLLARSQMLSLREGSGFKKLQLETANAAEISDLSSSLVDVKPACFCLSGMQLPKPSGRAFLRFGFESNRSGHRQLDFRAARGTGPNSQSRADSFGTLSHAGKSPVSFTT